MYKKTWGVDWERGYTSYMYMYMYMYIHVAGIGQICPAQYTCTMGDRELGSAIIHVHVHVSEIAIRWMAMYDIHVLRIQGQVHIT